MRRKMLTTALAMALLGGLGFAAGAAGRPGAVAGAATTGPYPVGYDFLANAAQYGAVPSSPGENDWSCKPSAAHPEPVVLVHGTAGSAAGNWATYSELLADQGYCVFAPTYGVPPQFASAGIPIGALGDMVASAHELATFVAQVLSATGARRVDLVGHSQGTLVPDYYVKFLGGAAQVDKYVSLAPLWHGELAPEPGSAISALERAEGYDPTSTPLCQACSEMLTGSALLDAVDGGSGGPIVPGVAYTNIVTAHDELVVPYTSGIWPGMTNIVVQSRCPLDLSDHTEIASDPVGAAYVLNALDPSHPVPVPCELVLPGVGPPAGT